MAKTELSLPAKFLLFHKLNPTVYMRLKAFVLKWRHEKLKKAGAKFYVEGLRWQMYFETNDPNYFYKLCNSYTAFYARMLMVDGVVPIGFFEIRQSRADEVAYDIMEETPGFVWFRVWKQNQEEMNK
jgi:hypothetical protein